MPTDETPVPDPRAVPATRLMLLSLWCVEGQPWRARIVLPDAEVLEFDSPFALAQYLGRPARWPRRPVAEGGGGLR